MPTKQEPSKEPSNDPLTSFFNLFSDDVKPKSYTNQPEIPEHYVNCSHSNSFY